MTRGFGRFLRRNTIALLALFLALGGTSYAAATLINGKQIKPHTIAKNRLTNKAIKQLKGNRGPQGPAGAAGAAGARGPTGPQGVAGANGTAIAYARVNADGTVDATNSKGVASANVTRIGAGAYCFAGLAFTPKSVIATPESPLAAADMVVRVGVGVGPSACAVGTQARVFTGGASAGLADQAFYVVLN
jgi:hypothetical protein